jgi:hypothetical protein
VVEELPPPTPTAVPEEPAPVRVNVPADPNPLFQMAAADALFDPVHPLPGKPKRERRKKPKQAEDWPDISALSQAWRERFRSLREAPATPLIELKLPDSWPLAPLPAKAKSAELKLPDQWPVTEAPMVKPRPQAPLKPIVVAPMMAETFEVLAYRMPTMDEATTMVISAADPSPPPPKFITARNKAERFAWESPEMYREE